MKILCTVLFSTLLLPQILLAESTSPSGAGHRFFLFDVTGQLGYGSVKSATDTASPSIGSFTLSLALGANIKRFSVGAEYDYRILSQHTEVDPAVGNRRGSFISPMSIFVRLNFDAVKFGYTMINSGTYDLMNTNSSGQKVSYLKPSGFRFNINFKSYKKVSFGLFYESVDFSDSNVGGVASTMTNKINYSNSGIGARYEF